MLSFIKCKPDWQLAESRHSIRKSMNNILDTVFMIKRVDYLEKSIEILFEEHQLKGLHLWKRMSIEDADKNYRKYNFGERLMYYVAEKKKVLKKK